MWNPLNGYIYMMRDFIWMNHMYFRPPVGTGELIVDPVNVEAQDGNASEGVDIQPGAPNKQDSEPDGDDDNVQDGDIASGTDSGLEGNGDDVFTTVTRS
jgi:hypothetical protein